MYLCSHGTNTVSCALGAAFPANARSGNLLHAHHIRLVLANEFQLQHTASMRVTTHMVQLVLPYLLIDSLVELVRLEPHVVRLPRYHPQGVGTDAHAPTPTHTHRAHLCRTITERERTGSEYPRPPSNFFHSSSHTSSPSSIESSTGTHMPAVSLAHEVALVPLDQRQTGGVKGGRRLRRSRRGRESAPAAAPAATAGFVDEAVPILPVLRISAWARL